MHRQSIFVLGSSLALRETVYIIQLRGHAMEEISPHSIAGKKALLSSTALATISASAVLSEMRLSSRIRHDYFNFLTFAKSSSHEFRVLPSSPPSSLITTQPHPHHLPPQKHKQIPNPPQNTNVAHLKRPATFLPAEKIPIGH
jgi:hypothetical protein